MIHRFSLLLFAVLVFCQLTESRVLALDETPPIAVEIVDLSPDSGGKLAYFLREKLRASHTFKLVSSASENRFRIFVSQMVVPGSSGSVATSIAWSWSLAGSNMGYYAGSTVAAGGAATQESVTDDILARTEQIYRELVVSVDTAAKAKAAKK